jgi:hypothetical protein
MVNFNLNIEQFNIALKGNGLGELRSIAFLQYPIYCMHFKIIDSTPEPMDKLDKVILNLLRTESLLAEDISTLLGLSKNLVEKRILILKDENLISLGTVNRLTGEGIEFLNNGTDEKRRKIRNIDIYLDGVKMVPMPKEFQRFHSNDLISEEKYSYRTRKNGETTMEKYFAPDIVHTAFIPEEIKNKIIDIPVENRTEYDIPEGLESIETISFTRLTFPVVISLSDSGENIYKTIANGYKHDGSPENISIISKELTGKISNFNILLNSDPYVKFKNNWAELDKSDFGKNRLFSISREDFKIALEKKYRIRELNSKDVKCTSSELQLYVSKEIIKNSLRKRKLAGNLLRKRDYIHSKNINNGVWLVFVSFVSTDNYTKELCAILDKYKNSSSKAFKKFLTELPQDYSGFTREYLRDLELQEIQEEIDMESFLFNPINK